MAVWIVTTLASLTPGHCKACGFGFATVPIGINIDARSVTVNLKQFQAAVFASLAPCNGETCCFRLAIILVYKYLSTIGGDFHIFVSFIVFACLTSGYRKTCRFWFAIVPIIINIDACSVRIDFQVFIVLTILSCLASGNCETCRFRFAIVTVVIGINVDLCSCRADGEQVVAAILSCLAACNGKTGCLGFAAFHIFLTNKHLCSFRIDSEDVCFLAIFASLAPCNGETGCFRFATILIAIGIIHKHSHTITINSKNHIAVFVLHLKESVAVRLRLSGLHHVHLPCRRCVHGIRCRLKLYGSQIDIVGATLRIDLNFHHHVHAAPWHSRKRAFHQRSLTHFHLHIAVLIGFGFMRLAINHLPIIDEAELHTHLAIANQLAFSAAYHSLISKTVLSFDSRNYSNHQAENCHHFLQHQFHCLS